MRRGLRAVPILLFGLGAALIAVSVATGTAQLALFLVFPVVTGASVTFLAGVLALLAAFVSMPFVWAEPEGLDRAGAAEPVTGGVILVGPVPFFFGTAGAAARTRYLWWVALGGLFTVLALVLGVAWALGR